MDTSLNYRPLANISTPDHFHRNAFSASPQLARAKTPQLARVNTPQSARESGRNSKKEKPLRPKTARLSNPIHRFQHSGEVCQNSAKPKAKVIARENSSTKMTKLTDMPQMSLVQIEQEKHKFERSIEETKFQVNKNARLII